jgi:hypothetical protein
MLAAVDFLSLREFERVEPDRDMAFISIGYPDDPAPASLVRFNAGIRLEFLDNEPGDIAAQGVEHLLLTGHQAKQVVAFIRGLHAEADSHRLVVHCTVGASRSAGVALAAHVMTGCGFPRRPEANYANPHVVSLLARECGLRIDIPEVPGRDYGYQPPSLLI